MEDAMTQLNRIARDIVVLGRQGDGLAAPDKARLRAKLVRRLGAGMAAGSLVSSGALVAEASRSTWFLKLVAESSLSVKVVGISALLVSTGAGIVGVSKLTLQHRTEPRQASAAQQHQRPDTARAPNNDARDAVITAEPEPQSTPQSTLPPNATPPEGASPTSAASRSESRAVQADPTTSKALAGDDTDTRTPTAVQDLNRQVEAIRQARSAIREGDGNAALGAIDEGVPPGQSSPLEEESTYSRILALCQVGRVTEARQQAELFLRRFPASPLSVRVRNSCGFGFGRFPD
jgi:hypothetical protein